jgi:glycosyltransferase involved in cell wall biosynthesis
MMPVLRREGVDPSIVVLSASTQVPWAARRLGARVEVLPGRALPARVLALRRRIRIVQPDVLHTVLFHANLVGRLAAWGTGVPVLTSLVSTSYDPIRFEDPRLSSWALRLVRVTDRWTGRHLTHHFHAITEAVKDAAVRDLSIPPDRITVVERGRDAERLGKRTDERRSRARAALGLQADDEVVIHVGRHVYSKGQRFLLEAMERLVPARGRLVLLLVGPPGPTTDELHAVADRSPARARIRFLGYREDVPDLLAAADLFAFPSLYEGLGGALIEAMALGLPIVASDLPASREVLEAGGNARLVERRSAPALAAAMAEILDDPERAARMGRRSREIFEARFRIERSAERTAALYRRLAGEAGTRMRGAPAAPSS